jgi:hypothetical protein
MLAMRSAAPKRSPLSTAEFATIRLRLIKIAARVVEGAAPHPCLFAHGMSGSRRLPRARRTVLRRRTVAIAALSPHRALRRNLQPVKIKS